MFNHPLIFFLNLILYFAVKTSFCQVNKFELNGYIKGVKNGKIILRETLKAQNIKDIKNKILVRNGKFKFKGEISDPTQVRFVLNDTLFSNTFFLESGKQQTIINIDSFSNSVIIKGSKSNNEYLNIYMPKMEHYENKKQNWYADIWNLENTFHQKVPVHIKDSMENILNYINKQGDSALLVYIKTYPKSKVAVWNLYYRIYGQNYISIYDSAYFLLNKQLKQSKTGIAIKKLLYAGRQTVIGAIFPTVNAIDSLGNLKAVFVKGVNKFTLIDFWFSDCLPCIRQFEELKNIYLIYEPKGFKISGVSIDNKKNEMNWRNIVHKNGLIWQQFWDMNGKEASHLSINTFPSNFLLDNNGKIISKNLEPFQLVKFLKENL